MPGLCSSFLWRASSCFALACLLVGVGCQTTGSGDRNGGPAADRWEADIARFEAADRTNPPPAGCILFVGSSSIRLWKTLAEDFPGLPIVNRGFGGSQLSDAIRYVDRIILPYQPRQIVLYSGANDINAGKSPEVVMRDFAALVDRIRADQPATPIAFISISPNPKRWAQVDEIREANRLVADYCRRNGLTFIDPSPLLLGPDGLPRTDLFQADGLHLNRQGYDLWRELISPHLVR